MVEKDHSKTMPLSGHLRELRRRLFYCLGTMLVFVIVAYVFRDFVFEILMRPLERTPEIDKLTTLGVTEPFMMVLKVSLYTGLVAASPVILYHFWAFMMPALHSRERRGVLLYTFLTTLLFLGGVTFAYFIVLPVGLKFLIGFGTGTFDQMLQADRYLDFISMAMLAFGLVFELPLIMMLLAWAHVLDYMRMRKVRRYAIVVLAVLAMVITPSGDPLSMLLMLGPLILLYELGIVLARMIYMRREKRKDKLALAEAEDTG